MSGGTSETAIYAMIERALESRRIRGGRVVDVGCGKGSLHQHIGHRFREYVGIDVVRYAGLPPEIRFIPLDLDSEGLPLDQGTADVVVAAETIEHLENPRAFMRQLAAAAKPGGWVVVTTPNQLSLLSIATLLFKNRFGAFQDAHYPAHLTALLEVDLRRIGNESRLTDLSVEYSLSGRVVCTAKHYPKSLARRLPRACSDNLLLIGQKLQ